MSHFGSAPLPESSVPKRSEAAAVEVTEVVALDRMREFIGWIDPMKDDGQVELALSEFLRRQQRHAANPSPLQTLRGETRVAGAYMMLLGARVAAVAGVRAIDNYSNRAVALLGQLVADVRSQGVVQIQAILNSDDSVATEIVEHAGFLPLADLQQLVLPIRVYEHLPNVALPSGLQWTAASQLPRARVVQAIAHTFIETLDCPELNGLRTPEDVLDGFLDGQSLEQQDEWWMLEGGDKLIGCVLVSRMANGAAELVYMGLGPTSRGRGYGRLLIEQAIVAAKRGRCETMVAAVDCSNWPATRLYLQAGFNELARVQAWFHQLRG